MNEVHEFDPSDDDVFEDTGDDDTCPHCNGSGEGMYDGTRCRFCKGTGTEKRK